MRNLHVMLPAAAADDGKSGHSGHGSTGRGGAKPPLPESRWDKLTLVTQLTASTPALLRDGDAALSLPLPLPPTTRPIRPFGIGGAEHASGSEDSIVPPTTKATPILANEARGACPTLEA